MTRSRPSCNKETINLGNTILIGSPDLQVLCAGGRINTRPVFTLGTWQFKALIMGSNLLWISVKREILIHIDTNIWWWRAAPCAGSRAERCRSACKSPKSELSNTNQKQIPQANQCSLLDRCYQHCGGSWYVKPFLNPNCNKSGRNSNVEFSIGPTSAEQKLTCRTLRNSNGPPHAASETKSLAIGQGQLSI